MHAVPTLTALAALGLAATGCGYVSEYVPPPDGRPRAIMMGSEVALVAAVAPSSVCAADAYQAVKRANQPARAPSVVNASTTQVRLDSGNLGQLRPLTLPRFELKSSVGRVVVPPGLGSFHGLAGGVHGGGGGGGMGNLGNMGKGAIIIPIIALTALSWVALGLALGRPESEEATALTLDEVNAERDLARLVGSPCDIHRSTP